MGESSSHICRWISCGYRRLCRFGRFAIRTGSNCICTLLIPLTLVLLSSRIFHETTQIQQPIYSGTCLVLGTSLNYIIDSSDLSATFLFSGTFLALLAIICLGWSSTQTTSKRNIPSDAIAAQKMEIGKGNAKFINHSVDEEEEMSSRNTLKYILILVFFGATNSSWTVCSTLAGEDVNPNLKALALIAGRVLVQFPVQYIYSKISSGTLSFTETIRRAFGMSSRDKMISRICGVLVGVGYWSYFNAVGHVNPAVAFAVSNCSPLVTTLVGVFLLGELQHYTTRGRVGVLTSSLLFVCAISLMSL